MKEREDARGIREQIAKLKAASSALEASLKAAQGEASLYKSQARRRKREEEERRKEEKRGACPVAAGPPLSP